MEDDIWLEVAGQPDEQGNGLLSQFKTLAGVGKLSAEQDELLLQEYRKGYRSFLISALEQHTTFEQYTLKDETDATVPARSLKAATRLSMG